jgi:hypothetical protein
LRVTTPRDRLLDRGVEDAPGLRGVTWRTGALLRNSSWSSREQIGHFAVSRL